MKNVLILLQLILTVQPRGLDPKFFTKDARANLSAEDLIESSTEQANDSYEFAFINNFLSSENVINNDLSEESSYDTDNKYGDRKKVYETNLKFKEGLEAKEESREDHLGDYSVLFGRAGAGSKTSRYNAGKGDKVREEDTSPNKMSLDTFMSTFLKSQSVSQPDQKSSANQKTATVKNVNQEEAQLLSHPKPKDLQGDDNQGRQRNDKFLFGNLDENRELVPLTPAKDRQLLIPFNPVDQAFVEAKYQNHIQTLPRLIDEAREVIIQDIATRNMMGYTIAGSFFIGAFLDTVGLTLLELKSFGELILKLISDKFWPGVYMFFWWYSFGYAGPWLFPAIFSGGDPNLKCSSADFFQLMNDHDLTLDIQSFTELSTGASVILVQRVTRDFNSKLSCIVNKRGDYKEAALVAQAFESMLFLTSLHSRLSNIPPPDPTPREIALLDSELLNLWAEIILITDQVYNEVLSRKAHTAVVYVFIGFLNVMGMVGGLMLYSAIAEDELTPHQPHAAVGNTEQHIQDVIRWVLSDGVDSHFIRSIGGTLFSIAPLSWGYGYWMTYFLFLETAEPGCGPLDRDDVYSKYIQLASLRDLLDTGISIPTVTYFIEEWSREMRAGLYCLLNTDEGVILEDSISMFYNLALTRLDLTGL